ncbi:hypothetical protein X975_14490, partial [Stegodyphus mimosarum]
MCVTIPSTYFQTFINLSAPPVTKILQSSVISKAFIEPDNEASKALIRVPSRTS